MRFKPLIVLLLLFFGVSGFAFSLSVPEKTPIGVAWNFEINTEPNESFYSIVASLDNAKVLTVYSNGQFVTDPFNGYLVIKVTPVGSRLFVAMGGLNAGNHSLTIETHNTSDEVLASKTVSFQTVQMLDSSFSDSMQAELNILKSQNDTLNQQLQEAKQATSALQEKLDAQGRIVETQKNRLQEVSELTDLLQKNQASVSSFNESAAQQLQQLSTRMDESEKLQSTGSNGLSGLAGLGNPGTFGLTPAAILGILIVLVIGGFTIYRHIQEKKLY